MVWPEAHPTPPTGARRPHSPLAPCSPSPSPAREPHFYPGFKNASSGRRSPLSPRRAASEPWHPSQSAVTPPLAGPRCEGNFCIPPRSVSKTARKSSEPSCASHGRLGTAVTHQRVTQMAKLWLPNGAGVKGEVTPRCARPRRSQPLAEKGELKTLKNGQDDDGDLCLCLSEEITP